MSNMDEIKEKLDKEVDDFTIRQHAYNDIVLQGSLLAAIQIIDQRLTFVEQRRFTPSQDTNIIDFFIDVLIDLALGQVGGKLLKDGLESVLTPIVRSRQGFYKITKIKEVDVKIKPKIDIELDKDQMKKAQKEAKKKVRSTLLRMINDEEYQAYKVYPEMLIDSALEVGSDEARSAINFNNRLTQSSINTYQKDSIIVQILSAAQNNYNLQRATIEDLSRGLKRKIQYSKIDETLANLFISLMSLLKSDLITDVNAANNLKPEIQRFYEKIMWVHLLKMKSMNRHLKSRHIYEPQLRPSDQVIATAVGDPANWKIIKDDDDKLIYKMPWLGSVHEYTLKLDKKVREYLITHFGYLQERTNHYKSYFERSRRMTSQKIDEVAFIDAIRSLVFEFEVLEREIDTSEWNIKKARNS